MSIKLKWGVTFLMIAVYAMVLGGIFYYNLFRWTFEEQLKNDTLQIIRTHAPSLLKGLQKNPAVITLEEMDILQTLARNKNIAQVLYLNKYGEVRWHRDPSRINLPFEEHQKQAGPTTDAIQQAYLAKAPKIRSFERENQRFYEIAAPILSRNEPTGILSLHVTREEVSQTIGAAMKKYAVGALGIVLILGIPLQIFFSRFVFHPLQMLLDAVENLNTRNLELKFPKRRDEFGKLAQNLQSLLGRLREELAAVQHKGEQRGRWEQRRWESLVRVLAQSRQAIIVDENNNVLYTNFPVLKAATQGMGTSKLHLLDVVDSRQQELLRLVNWALEHPNEPAEGDTDFRGRPCHVRILNLEDTGEDRRTIILFEPKKESTWI
ncbi:MAG: hypothetical protein HY402_07240 [Elusimicrobia bacterium]|nr:hypothetical protein [Elusimicrobiota bacterium]